MTAEQKIKYLPAGGIAGFVMSNEDINKLEAEELQEQYGTTGIAQFSTIGKNMANFGRHGDDTVAHVETGELIVPRALIENNPDLKESIFNHLRELGVQDPERYVVGAAKNSINPETGLPEFFLGKFLKKISRGLSSTAKGVGKALKKAAPIILPIALAMTPLGPIYGAALGSGIGTLVNGGSAEDAFKSALIAGASGAAFSGARGTLSADLANPMGRIGQTATGFGNTLTGEGFTGDGNLFSSYRPEVTNGSENFGVKKRPVMFEGDGKERSIGDKFFRGNRTELEVTASMDKAQQDYLAQAKIDGFRPTQAGIERVRADAGPNFLQRAGPSLALATAAGAAGGMFDAPEEEPVEETYTGMDKYNENPDMYNIASLTPQYIQGDPSVASKYPYYIPQAAAQGGQIFPRRVGGIMPDEGIPNKDSVRAMLMPGEFVMTTDAVKGLGGGNMDKGINNMYSVMRNLEQRGRGAA